VTLEPIIQLARIPLGLWRVGVLLAHGVLLGLDPPVAEPYATLIRCVYLFFVALGAWGTHMRWMGRAWIAMLTVVGLIAYWVPWAGAVAFYLRFPEIAVPAYALLTVTALTVAILGPGTALTLGVIVACFLAASPVARNAARAGAVRLGGHAFFLRLKDAASFRRATAASNVKGARIRSSEPTEGGREWLIRMKPGDTIDDLDAARIASAAGVGLKRVRLEPVPDDHQHVRAIVREVDLIHDIIHAPPIDEIPLADPWDALPFGRDEDNEVVELGPFDPPGILIAGVSGSGKSNALGYIIACYAALTDVGIVGLDPKGSELADWAPMLPPGTRSGITQGRATLALGREPAAHLAVLEALNQEIDHRYDLLARLGAKKLSDPRVAGKVPPPILLVIDEAAILKGIDERIANQAAQAAQYGRAAGVAVIMASQRTTGDEVLIAGRDQLATRLQFGRTTDLGTMRAALGHQVESDVLERGVDEPGRFLGWVASRLVVGRAPAIDAPGWLESAAERAARRQSAFRLPPLSLPIGEGRGGEGERRSPPAAKRRARGAPAPPRATLAVARPTTSRPDPPDEPAGS
jgi:FtsK/SpoIIIE family